MHYYQHHIGDFIRDTARLSDSQCMAYLRMIWHYYETEQPIENDVDAIAFRFGANASDVHQILKHYFFLHEGRWHNSRCDKEILAFRSKSEKAKESANARWENAKAMRTHSERNADEPISDANHKPITNNHKPKDKSISAFAPPIPDELLKDWLEVRKAKRAGKLTKTAWTGLANQAAKAGISPEQAVRICCERGWQSFNASWNWKGVDEPPKPAAHVMTDTSQYAPKPIDKNAWKANLEAAKLGMKMKGE